MAPSTTVSIPSFARSTLVPQAVPAAVMLTSSTTCLPPAIGGAATGRQRTSTICTPRHTTLRLLIRSDSLRVATAPRFRCNLLDLVRGQQPRFSQLLRLPVDPREPFEEHGQVVRLRQRRPVRHGSA